MAFMHNAYHCVQVSVASAGTLTLMLGAGGTSGDGGASTQRQRTQSVGGFGSVATSGVLDVLDRPCRSTAAIAAEAIAAYEGAQHGSAAQPGGGAAGRGWGRHRAADDAAAGIAGWRKGAAGTVGAKQAPATVAGAGCRVRSASAASTRAPAGGGWSSTKLRAEAAERLVSTGRGVPRATGRDEAGLRAEEDAGGDVMCDAVTGVGMHVGHVRQQLREAPLEGLRPPRSAARSTRAAGGRISPLLGRHTPDLT